jgi:hypothetical protein
MIAQELEAPTLERMRPLWAEFADALRVDPALLLCVTASRRAHGVTRGRRQRSAGLHRTKWPGP